MLGLHGHHQHVGSGEEPSSPPQPFLPSWDGDALLPLITAAHLQFSDGISKDILFSKLLQGCVDLTESSFGFIGELIGPLNAPSMLHIISFNAQASLLTTTCTTLDLTSPLTRVITTRSPFITNSLTQGDLPPSFPSIQSFLGIPIFHREDLIGMLGFADRKEGYDSTVASSLSSMAITSGTLMVGYRKTSEQQSKLLMLEKAKMEAEQSAIAKAHFLFNMSHEIRTPLNGIVGLTSLLLDSQLTFDQREMVETVQSSGDLLLSVVNDILDLAKFEAGKLDLHQRHFDIRACVEACIDVVAIGAERKGIELLCDISADVPATMLGDYDRVRQIITNLVGNAVKFTERGEVIVGVKMESSQVLQLQRTFSGGLLDTDSISEGVGTNTNGSKVVHFWVRDTGIGIPKDKKDLLFQMYTQIDPYRTNGTGLGLSICKRLVEAMLGKIWATSELGKGSCFHFAIPAIFSTDSTPYYPPITGKSLNIFSNIESHARVLTEFAHQHAMTTTTQIMEPTGLLTPSQLQSLSTCSAVVIEAIYPDRIVSQIERYFKDGRASPATPGSTTPSLDVRSPWPASINAYSLLPSTFATSPASSPPSTFQPAIPPLRLPTATLRVAQISPMLPNGQSNEPNISLAALSPRSANTSSVSSNTTPTSSTTTSPTNTPKASNPPSTTQERPTLPNIPTKPPTPTATSAPTKNSLFGFSGTKLPQLPAKETATKSSVTEPSKQMQLPESESKQKRRARTSSVPAPVSPSRQRRNTSPSRGKFLAMFSSMTSSSKEESTSSTNPQSRPLPSPPSPKSASKPVGIPHRSTSVPKTMPPSSLETPSKLSQSAQSRSNYTMAYLNATQSTSPPKMSSSLPNSSFPRAASEPFGTPTKRQFPVAKQTPSQTTPPSTQLVFTKQSINKQPATPRGATSPTLSSTSASSTSTSTSTSHSSTTNTKPSPREGPIVSPRGASNPQYSISPRMAINNNLPTPLSTSINPSNLRINTNLHHQSTNTQSTGNTQGTGNTSNPSSTASTPSQSPTISLPHLPSSSSSSSINSGINSSSSSPSISTPSTPSSPSCFPPCPILMYVPLGSPSPRTICANLYFIPKPLRLSRLSRKLETILLHPHSPSTPYRLARSSHSRLSTDDFHFDHSMAINHPLTILVGEDNLVGQVVTQRMLTKLGYSAEFCGSGDAVLAKLENRIFDVVLLDLKMPVCDGFECARRICAALPPGHRPHIAAVTANILQSDRDLAAAVGFNDYITKPFLLSDLARVLHRCKRLDPDNTMAYTSLPRPPPSPSPPSSSPASPPSPTLPVFPSHLS